MQIQCFANGFRQGTYILFIHLSKKSSLCFGNFLGGKKIHLEPGFYMYIGSALNKKPSSMPLARRLVRHASRSNGKPAHEAREFMIRFFQKHQLATADLQPPANKKLHWHIDYLLDCPDARIITAFVIRSPLRLETAVSDLAESLDETFIIARKLGARDTRSGTHLLGIRDLDSCLEKLERAIPLICRDNRIPSSPTPSNPC